MNKTVVEKNFYKQQVKELKVVEDKLIHLIAETNNTNLMDTFLDWQNKRSLCNESYIEMLECFIDNNIKI